MTVAALPSVVSYVEDGVTVRFPVPYRFDIAGLIVERIVDGLPLKLAAGVDYSAIGGETDAGGTLTRTVATDGGTLRIRRATPLAQSMTYTTGDRFPADSHENALDRQAMATQDVARDVADVDARALLAPPGEVLLPMGPLESFRGKAIGLDAANRPVPVAIGDANDPGLRADLATGNGGLVGVRLLASAAILRSVGGKTSDAVNVRDFGARGNAVYDPVARQIVSGASDTAALQAALREAGGGDIIIPAGYWAIDDRLLVEIDNTRLIFEAGAVIVGDPWTYPGAQLPFGSAVLATASNIAVVGAGIGQSGIILTGGSEANAITFLHCDGGLVRGLTLDGGMTDVTAILDDTFMSGINALNATGGNAGGRRSKVLIEQVEALHWAQYGMQAYGDLAEVDFVRCWCHHNGIANQPHSVGSGIAVTRGNRGVTIRHCTLEDNKQDGIFVTSAGLDLRDLAITDNLIRRNGRWGITATEERNFRPPLPGGGVDPNAGMRRLSILNNLIDNNGLGAFDGKGGVRLGTFDDVGDISDVTSSGNLITRNQGYGHLVQTNDHAVHRTSRIFIDDMVTGNSVADIAIGAKVDETVRWNAAKLPGGVVDNAGDSELATPMRGLSGRIASAQTITPPPNGDVVVLTGSAVIRTITPAPGRTISFVSAGNPTFANDGNIRMTEAMVLPGNSGVQLVCIDESWFRIGGSINA